MLKKLIFAGIMALFALSLLPISASATTSALQSGTLIKGANASVYYYGADGKRYVFPTENTYKTWYLTFNTIISISSDLMGEIPIGGNVTYKPGVKLVKITTDPKVYYVDKEGTLRWVISESLAKNLWGTYWYKMIDDVPDPFFVNYKIGEPLENPEITAIPTTYSINQDKLISDQPDPAADDISKITLTGTVNGDLVKLSWSANFSSPLGFKSIKAEHANPIYPGDDYHYLSTPYNLSADMQDIPVVGDTWEKLPAGTYHFRVCEYLNGSCGVYSNELSLTIAGTTTNTESKTITLSKSVSGNTVSLSWVPSFTSSMGFKIVKAEHVNPVYPGDDYHYLSDAGARSDTWEGLSAGTYHFRVCEYLGGACGVYSNDVTVTIASTTTETSSGSISLSGNVNSGNVYLNWVLSGMTSSLGFKVVKAEHVNPVYPGDEYHYYSDANLRADTWEGVPAGTWHFRVCEYLGGSCGIYSNDLTITVQ